jgi:acyl-coenzyme A synthetase/AMP-(fatty) acid ligase
MSAAGNLTAWLLEAALANGVGARCALREGDRAWTYDELADQVGRLSAALRGLRLQRGERVLILMSDTLEAAAAGGAVVVAAARGCRERERSESDAGEAAKRARVH